MAPSIPELLRAAIPHAFRKLDPRLLIRNPVIFVVELSAALVTTLLVLDVVGIGGDIGDFGREVGFQVQIAAWLWFTVLFATYAEAVAEAAVERRPRRCGERGRKRPRIVAARRRQPRGSRIIGPPA